MPVGHPVADRHAIAAPSADDEALEQGHPFARGGAPTVPADAVGIGAERRLIRLKFFPRDVARVRVGQEDFPVLAGQPAMAGLAREADLPLPSPAIHIRPRVAWIVQDPEHAMMRELADHDRPRAGAADHALWPRDPLRPEVAHHGAGRSGPPEGLEQEAHGPLDLLVRIEDELAPGGDEKAQRRTHPQLAAAGFIELPSDQARPQHMQLGFAHRALEPQQQAVIEVGGIVEAILVENERLTQRTDLQQTMPIARIPSESRDLEAHDYADTAQADVGDESLEAAPFARRCPRQPEVLIDDHDLLG